MSFMSPDGVVNRCGIQRRSRPVVRVMDMSDGRRTFPESSAKRHARGGRPLQRQRRSQQPREDDAKSCRHETSLANRTETGRFAPGRPMPRVPTPIMPSTSPSTDEGLQMLKKVAIGLGIVAALLLLAGVAAALLIDVNSYKPTIERMVTDATGRKLSIDGPLSLRLFPRLGVALPKSTLSEQGGDLHLRRCRRPALRWPGCPCWRGRIVIDQVMSTACKQRSSARPTAAPTSTICCSVERMRLRRKATTNRRATSVSIRGIALNDANLSLRSADGSTITLSKLDLKVDDLGAADYKPVRVSASVTSTKPALVADVTLAAKMQVDAANSRYGVRDLVGSVKGTFDQQPMEVRLAAARAAWQPLTVEVEKLVLSGAGKRGPSVRAEVHGAAICRKRVARHFDPVELAYIEGRTAARAARHRRRDQRDGGSLRSHDCCDVQARCGFGTHRRKADEPVAGQPRRNDLRVPALGRRRRLDASELAAENRQTVAQRQRVDRCQARTGRAETQERTRRHQSGGQLDISGFKSPRIAFDVSADQLDLDRHFPPAPKSVEDCRDRHVEGKSRTAIPRSTWQRCEEFTPPATHGSASCACAGSMRPMCGSFCKRKTASSTLRRSPHDCMTAR